MLLRRSSREIVDRDRPNRRAIAAPLLPPLMLGHDQATLFCCQMYKRPHAGTLQAGRCTWEFRLAFSGPRSQRLGCGICSRQLVGDG